MVTSPIFHMQTLTISYENLKVGSKSEVALPYLYIQQPKYLSSSDTMLNILGSHLQKLALKVRLPSYIYTPNSPKT